MFTSHVVTQTIKKTYTEGLRFKTNNFYYFRKDILKDLEIFFYCEQEEVKNPTSTSLVSWSWFILKHQDVCPLLLLHHQCKYQFVRKTNNALMLLWKYVCPYGHPGRVSGLPRGPRTTLKTMSLRDSLAFFFLNEVDLFNRDRYEESFVKLSSQSPGKQKNFSSSSYIYWSKFCPRKHQVCTASFLVSGCLAFSQESPRMEGELLCPHADSRWRSTWKEPM